MGRHKYGQRLLTCNWLYKEKNKVLSFSFSVEVIKVGTQRKSPSFPFMSPARQSVRARMNTNGFILYTQSHDSSLNFLFTIFLSDEIQFVIVHFFCERLKSVQVLDINAYFSQFQKYLALSHESVNVSLRGRASTERQRYEKYPDILDCVWHTINDSFSILISLDMRFT